MTTAELNGNIPGGPSSHLVHGVGAGGILNLMGWIRKGKASSTQLRE